MLTPQSVGTIGSLVDPPTDTWSNGITPPTPVFTPSEIKHETTNMISLPESRPSGYPLQSLPGGTQGMATGSGGTVPEFNTLAYYNSMPDLFDVKNQSSSATLDQKYDFQSEESEWFSPATTMEVPPNGASPQYPATPASASPYSPYNFFNTHSRSNSNSNSNPRSASPALSVASAITSVSSSTEPPNTQAQMNPAYQGAGNEKTARLPMRLPRVETKDVGYERLDKRKRAVTPDEAHKMRRTLPEGSQSSELPISKPLPLAHDGHTVDPFRAEDSLSTTIPHWIEYKIPQRPHNPGPRQRYFRPSQPITFSVKGLPGVNMRSILSQRFIGLDGWDDPVLQRAGGSISCRLKVR